MKRREFITLVGGRVATWYPAMRAQHSAMPVIGFIGPAPADTCLLRVEALRAGLRDLGYVEGRNIVIEFRWAERVKQLPEMAAELLRMKYIRRTIIIENVTSEAIRRIVSPVIRSVAAAE